MDSQDATKVSHEAPTVELPPLGPPAPAKVRVAFGARSHVGKVRTNNEDHYLIARLRKSMSVLQTNLPEEADQTSDQEAYLMVVADGMGGHAGGERASALAIHKAEQFILNGIKWFYRHDDPDESGLMRDLRDGLQWVEQQIVAAGRVEKALAGMGTTLTGVYSFGTHLLVLHVGDSRAYLFQTGQLQRLTRDHTLAQQMLDEGMLQPQDIRSTGLRHVLTNVIGGPVPGAVGEIHKLQLADGDRLLLCTDGLTEMVADDQIAAALHAHARPDDACQALVDAALKAGGRDNVSVIMAAYAIEA